MRSRALGHGKWPTSRCTARRMRKWPVRWSVDQFSLRPMDERPLIRIWMMSCTRWRAMRTCRGKAAGIQCRGNMPADRSGCASAAVRSKCITAGSGSRSHSQAPPRGFRFNGRAEPIFKTAQSYGDRLPTKTTLPTAATTRPARPAMPSRCRNRRRGPTQQPCCPARCGSSLA